MGTYQRVGPILPIGQQSPDLRPWTFIRQRPSLTPRPMAALPDAMTEVLSRGFKVSIG